ncbi:hypothetical protein BGX29_005108 [Mortierella sp. GBA35]|nr:hypothetical protein BGX29_005108 [Mortierella sp. GBA35]
MSKRGTENQLTKDEYDRDADNDEGSNVMGAFKQASQEEMSKRVIKAPRSRRLNGGGGGDDAAKPSPFASMVSFSAPAPTSGASPFASVSLAASTAGTTGTTTSTPAKPFSTGAFNFGVPPFSTSTTPASTLTSVPNTSTPSTTKEAPLFTAAAKTPSTLPGFTPGAFSFNMGIKGKTSTDTSSPKPSSADTKSEALDREELERYFQALNRTFAKKVEKELANNPIVNLAQIFGQYMEKRQAMKKKHLSSGDSKSSASSSPALGFTSLQNSGSSTTSAGSAMSSVFKTAPSSFSTTTTTATSGADSAAPKLSFGLPLSAIGENPAPKPAFSGFNFGITPSTSGADSKPSTATTTATMSSAFAFAPKPFSTTPASTTATSTTTPAPFAFNSSKGFSFSPSASFAAPSSSSGGSGGFQFSVPASHPSEKRDDGDNEKMPDDTKSELVDNRAGEEGEETVFEVRAKLYAVVDGENKDLGVGQFRVNENTETKKRRMIMRTGGIGLLILNSWVIQGMSAKRTKNFVTLFAVEDGKPKKFLLKVKEEPTAEEVVKELEAGQNK